MDYALFAFLAALYITLWVWGIIRYRRYLAKKRRLEAMEEQGRLENEAVGTDAPPLVRGERPIQGLLSPLSDDIELGLLEGGR